MSALWPWSWSSPVLLLLFVFIPSFVPVPVSCSVSVSIAISFSVPISFSASLWAFGQSVWWWWWRTGWELPRTVCSLWQSLLLSIRGWHAVQLRRCRTGQSRVGFLQLRRKRRNNILPDANVLNKQFEDTVKRMDKWLTVPRINVILTESQNPPHQWKINTEVFSSGNAGLSVKIKDLFIQYLHVKPCQCYILMQDVLITQFWNSGYGRVGKIKNFLPFAEKIVYWDHLDNDIPNILKLSKYKS